MLLELFGRPFIKFIRTPKQPKGETKIFNNCAFSEVYPMETQPVEGANTIAKALSEKEELDMVTAIAKESGAEKSLVEYILRLGGEYLQNGGL